PVHRKHVFEDLHGRTALDHAQGADQLFQAEPVIEELFRGWQHLHDGLPVIVTGPLEDEQLGAGVGLLPPTAALQVGARLGYADPADTWIDPTRVAHSGSRFRTLSMSRPRASTERTLARGIQTRTVVVFVVAGIPLSEYQ